MSRRRGQPDVANLRERVLAATGKSIRATAARFSISPSYVWKVHARLRATGKAAPDRSAITFVPAWSRSTMHCGRGLRGRWTRRLSSRVPG